MYLVVIEVLRRYRYTSQAYNISVVAPCKCSGVSYVYIDASLTWLYLEGVAVPSTVGEYLVAAVAPPRRRCTS
jgi:hypothetical protein